MKISCSTPVAAFRTLRRTPTVLALTTLAALTACGGGDDPTAPVAAAPAPIPAAPATPTAPTITSAPQSLTVGEGTSASFSVSGTSNAGTLRYEWALNGGGTIAGADASSYTIAATSLVDDGKQLFARLLNDAGSSTSPAVSLTVNERQWATATAPDLSMQTAEAAEDTQAVAVDSLGHTHLLYGQRQDNGSVTLRWALKPQGAAAPTSSGSLAQASLAPFASMQAPRLVSGPEGTMLAVWREGVLDEGGNVVKAALYRPAAGGWSLLGTVSTDGALDANMPAAAHLGAHHFELVWLEHDGSVWNVHARRLEAASDTASWTPAEAVEAVAASATHPMIASDGQGHSMIIFSTLGSPWRAWANTRASSDTAWQAAGAQEFSNLSNETARVSHLAMNSHGRAVALFHSDETRVYMRQYQFGGTAPGWQGSAAYVANRWDGLDAAVQPVVLLDDSSTTRFSIVSIHNNGAFVSRWNCAGLACDGPQTFLNAGSAGVNDFTAGRDAAGNLIVVAAIGQSFGSADSVLAIRHHAALDSWRMPGHGGNARPAGKLRMAVHPDGSATTLQTSLSGETRVVRSADFR